MSPPEGPWASWGGETFSDYIESAIREKTAVRKVPVPNLAPRFATYQIFSPLAELDGWLNDEQIVVTPRNLFEKSSGAVSGGASTSVKF
jgi:hypothetical protein